MSLRTLPPRGSSPCDAVVPAAVRTSELIIVLFGPPGSGKGTQASRLQAEFGLEHISTGDMLRAESARGTPAGRRVAAIMAAGDLVPDEVILDLLRRRLAAPGAGRALFDGFPRTVKQAVALDRLLAESGRRVDVVIALAVPEPVLVARIMHRAAIEGRSDDTREAIAERMREYRLRTMPVLDRYRKRGVGVREVNGLGTPDEVFSRVREAVGATAA